VVAVTAGVSTGFFGLPGLAIDLPVLVANTVGLVRRHAVTYGFTTIEDSTNDPTPLLLALGASVGADMVIDRVGVKVGEKLSLDLGTKLVEKYLVSRISEQFAARIVTSWLPRMVPIIGTATIAALDTAFLTLAGRESTRYFRRRHMEMRQYIVAARIDRAGGRRSRQVLLHPAGVDLPPPSLPNGNSVHEKRLRPVAMTGWSRFRPKEAKTYGVVGTRSDHVRMKADCGAAGATPQQHDPAPGSRKSTPTARCPWPR
jgi:hypothetical protein